MDERIERALDAAERFLNSVHPHGDDLRALKREALDAIAEARAPAPEGEEQEQAEA